MLTRPSSCAPQIAADAALHNTVSCSSARDASPRHTVLILTLLPAPQLLDVLTSAVGAEGVRDIELHASADCFCECALARVRPV